MKRNFAFLISFPLTVIIITPNIVLANVIFSDNFDERTNNWDVSIATSGPRWCVSSADDEIGKWLNITSSGCYGLTEKPPFGYVTLKGGDLAVGSGGQSRAFPYIWSNPIPLDTSDSFSITIKMKYDSIAPHGSGVVFRPWVYPALNGTNSPFIFDETMGYPTLVVWAQTTDGFDKPIINLYVGNKSFQIDEPYASHSYKLFNLDGEYSLSIDDRLLPLDLPNHNVVQQASIPYLIWIGNPRFADASNTWNSFTLQRVQVNGTEIVSQQQRDLDHTQTNQNSLLLPPIPPYWPSWSN